MPTSYHFIFIDDNSDYHETLRSHAREQGVVLKAFDCGIDGMKELKNNPDKYLGVILDFNCKFKKDDNPEVGTLTRILAELNALNKSLPRVVLSGDPDAQTQKKFHPTLKFFNKNNEAKQCIIELKNQAKKYPIGKIKEKNEEVFSIFEKQYLDSSSERELIAILKNSEKNDCKPVRGDLGPHRLIIASSLQAILKCRSDLFDSNLPAINLTGDPVKIELGPYIENLKNKVLHRDSIPFLAVKFVNDMTRKHGHHNNYQPVQIENPSYYGSEPSLYTLKTITNCLMDYLKWFQIWMDKNANINN